MKISRRRAITLAAAAAATSGSAFGATARGQQDKAFAAIGARWLDGVARLNPVYATGLGDHRFDGEMTNVSATAQAQGRAFRRLIKADLAKIDEKRLGRDARIDYRMLKNELALANYQDEQAQSLAWDPLVHNSVVGGALYSLMARDFAPLPERLRSATARMEKLPDVLAQTRQTLSPERTPRIHAETYSRQHPGVASIIDGLILKQAQALSGADRSRLEAAAEKAKAAIKAHQAWIDGTLIPGARGDFRLGAGLYDRKLALALHSPMSRGEIGKAARDKFAQTRAEMAEIARRHLGRAAPGDDQAAIDAALEQAYADRSARDGVVAFAELTLKESTAFLRAKDVITLPDAPVKIIIMPEFQQGVAVAYCDSPGPLEKHLDTFYAVSPIPQSWTDEQAQSFLKEYNHRSIHELTVHEAMPGHFVQLWHANKHPSTLRAVLGSGTFIEGWACYAQDMMGEIGYWGDDPLRRLINLKWALRVIANSILDIGVHVEGMSREQAMDLMVRQAFQTEREAAGKWVRAQVSSAQLPTYFVGWTEHWALRREAQQRWGQGFALKRYHDTVLSFGSPPVRYARAMMFNEEIV